MQFLFKLLARVSLFKDLLAPPFPETVFFVVLILLFQQFRDLLVDCFEAFSYVFIGTFFGQSQVFVELSIFLFNLGYE